MAEAITNLEGQEPDEIRRKIEQTKASLSEKIDTLQHEVQDTVSEARTSVEHTFADVKRAFSLKHQIESHPLPFFGGSIILGLILGKLISPEQRSIDRSWSEPAYSGSVVKPNFQNTAFQSGGSNFQSAGSDEELSTNGAFTDRVKGKTKNLVKDVLGDFEDELQELKSLAIGALIGTFKEAVTHAVPPAISGKVGQVIDSATTKLGGKPISTNRPLV